MSVKNAFIQGNVLNQSIKTADKLIGVATRKVVYRNAVTQNNKIFVMTYDSSYTCNPSYIVDELCRRQLPLDIVVVGPGKGQLRGEEHLPEGVRVVKRNSAEMYNEQSTAKIWIDNALNCVAYGMPKREDQILINTWHGSMGIKRLAGDAKWMYNAAKCEKMTDYCIANSVFEENVYRDTFWKTTPILRYGHARNDLLFQLDKAAEVKARVQQILNLPEQAKILLYAPTFRDNGNVSCFDIDYARLKANLENKFGGKWVILVRMHFKNRKESNRIGYNEWLINASDYGDMQELMVAADAGITDYSSWAYDYVLSRKPMFLYVPDAADYDQDRGFYYRLDQTPFGLAYNNEDLEKAVKGFDVADYQNKIDAFLEDKGCYERGQGAKLAADKIVKLLGLDQ